METEQLKKIWISKFGDEYTRRKLLVHEKEGEARKAFWSMLFNVLPDVKSVIEIGCNAGMNLEAIYEYNSTLEIRGIEPNKYALIKAHELAAGRYIVLPGNVFEMPPDLKADMIFTCTVLIHISPNNLISALKNIYAAANSNILLMEYYWPELKEIEYRGLRNALWKQDYGVLLLKNFDVKLIETGYLDKRDGFDRVTWWLFEK